MSLITQSHVVLCTYKVETSVSKVVYILIYVNLLQCTAIVCSLISLILSFSNQCHRENIDTFAFLNKNLELLRKSNMILIC